MPRSTARPEHPGVILAFESKHGPLKYATDRFDRPQWGRGRAIEGWQHNLRAVALGLEALRKVDRYGITKRGEQYRGWNALGAGEPMPATHMTTEEAARFLALWGGPWSEPGRAPDQMVDDLAAGILRDRLVENAYRLAAKRLHPDVEGGDEALFVQLQAARDLLTRSALTGGTP